MVYFQELLQNHRRFAHRQPRILQRDPFGRSGNEIHFGIPVVPGDRRCKRFRGIAQDSIVMNLDDLVCVGIWDQVVLSSTVNRNARNFPGEALAALIEGTEAFLQTLADNGISIKSGGGETAGVGDLTGTVAVDSCAVAVCPREKIIDNAGIVPGLSIVGLSSCGQANYETFENSGIGSNGLTSAGTNFFLLIIGKITPKLSIRKPIPNTFTADRTGCRTLCPDRIFRSVKRC